MGNRLLECLSPRILHLATHGFFLADQECDPNKDARGLGALSSQPGGGLAAPRMENPLLRSGLAWASWKNEGFMPPPEAEDGLLTMAGWPTFRERLIFARRSCSILLRRNSEYGKSQNQL